MREQVTWLAMRHLQYKARPEHVQTFGQVLVAALEQVRARAQGQGQGQGQNQFTCSLRSLCPLVSKHRSVSPLLVVALSHC